MTSALWSLFSRGTALGIEEKLLLKTVDTAQELSEERCPLGISTEGIRLPICFFFYLETYTAR